MCTFFLGPKGIIFFLTMGKNLFCVIGFSRKLPFPFKLRAHVFLSAEFRAFFLSQEKKTDQLKA